MTITTPQSSFIESLSYLPMAPSYRNQFPGKGFLIVRMTGRARRYCYLVPSWTAGLVAAAKARGTSMGRLYNLIVKGLPNVKVEVE